MSDMEKMDNETLLAQYITAYVEMHEDFLRGQSTTFEKERALEEEVRELREEILKRMGD